MGKQLRYLLLGMRPTHRSKNIVIVLPLIFYGKLLNGVAVEQTVLAVLFFILCSGSVYLFNDLKDIEHDRLHPKKSQRPLVSGKLNKRFALVAACIMVAVSVSGAFIVLGKTVGMLFVLYLLNTAIYIFEMKNTVLLDIFFIAVGFIVRGLIGIYVAGTPLSLRFLLILFFGTLYLGYIKRFQEVALGVQVRKLIHDFDRDTLKHLITMFAALTIGCYALFIMRFEESELLAISIPFLTFAIVKCMHAVFIRKEYAEGLEKVILFDEYIIGSLVGFFAVVIGVLYVYRPMCLMIW